MRAELLKGHTELLLLQTLDAGPAHGYLVIDRLRELSQGALDLPEGTVYPVLHRLERAGAIRSQWDASGPRRRRIYELTPRGHSVLRAKRTEWTGFVQAITSVVGTGHA
ncbi:MAG TPA: helix-turn-helix transcriptional regulator [Gaiellales bacterium]|jgi:DNA-binding PadR family transcriptional regulator|nr:helix-turn-helix transcriptional regulator [Gaiellales bacterium]